MKSQEYNRIYRYSLLNTPERTWREFEVTSCIGMFLLCFFLIVPFSIAQRGPSGLPGCSYLVLAVVTNIFGRSSPLVVSLAFFSGCPRTRWAMRARRLFIMIQLRTNDNSNRTYSLPKRISPAVGGKSRAMAGEESAGGLYARPSSLHPLPHPMFVTTVFFVNS